MRNLYLILGLLIALPSLASNDLHSTDDPYEIRIVDKSHLEVDDALQYQLRHSIPWSTYKTAHPGWLAMFDEDNFKPSRAFGPGLTVTGEDAEQRALNFIQNDLALFNIPEEDLQLRTVTDNGKHHQVFFYQTYEGLEVLYSKAMVKMTHDAQVISWSAVVHNDIDLSTEATVNLFTANEIATEGFDLISDVSFNPEFKILSIPKYRDYEHHLVYEATVSTVMDNGVPAEYTTHIDAHTGEILQRINQIHTFHGPRCGHEENKAESSETLPVVNANFNAGLIYPDPNFGTTVLGLPNLRIGIGGDDFYTDEAGDISTTELGPVTANVPLSGFWATVYNDNTGTTPTTSVDLQEGENDISLTEDFTAEQLSAYYNTNIIHDYVKEVLQDYEGMDYDMTVNVGITPHECNAFSTGNSINFYVGSFDCVSLVTVADVVFHEYGHEVNGNFYNDLGAGFSNGAMNEGYADVWAFMVIEDPILADGHNPTDSEDYIRRYDMDPKVYPQDITGSVHGDGEIIAGAWWDTYLLMGNDIETTEELWRLAYPGLQAATFNGNEGEAYLDVLIDVLEADDDDGNILNGTPNGAAISEGFAIHGITFLATAELEHTELVAIDEDEVINLEADLDISDQFTDYLNGVFLNYRFNDSDEWSEVEMFDEPGADYSAEIPAQPEGTIVAYYMVVKDIFDNLAVVNPVGANQPDPSLPYYTMVGYELIEAYDSDDEDEITAWETELDSDNATTGIWEEAFPVGSFLNGINVAPSSQATEDGEFCFVTGNSFSPSDGIGVNDVDAGTTTLISEEIDLTDYIAPAFTYKRWYTNATGANPNADWWQVQISDDGGESWVYVEDTRSSDASWRRFAFRIGDYVDLTENFMIKFNASDSLRPGTNLDGGSLVEAALDDFMLYDQVLVDDVSESALIQGVDIFPNPASDQLQLNIELSDASDIEIRVYSNDGRLVRTEPLGRQNGSLRYELAVSDWSSGLYTIELRLDDGILTRNFTVR